MPIAGRFVVQSVSALLIVGLLALAGIVGTTMWLNERSQAYFADVIEARDVRSAAVELRSAMQSAESSQRGMLLTGNEIYLAPLDTAKTAARRRLALLQEKAAVAGPAGIVERLAGSVTAKFAEIDQTVTLKLEGKDAEALAIVRTNRGKLLMDEVNLFVSGIVRTADDRLTTGVAEQRANATRLRLVSLASALLIIAVVGGGAATVYRYTREITHARNEVDALNASLEQRVATRTADLARANEEMQQFAHIVSHDLRAPLVNIVGFAGELEQGLISVQAALRTSGNTPDGAPARLAAETEMPEAIAFIRSSSRKMDNLINAILKLSREGRRQLQAQSVDLGTTIKATLAAIQHQISEAGGTIRLDLQVTQLVTDRLSLEQILGNLFDNAVKYRSHDRPLSIDVRSRQAPDDRVIIEIADNGRGIAGNDLGRVFELFRRAGVRDRAGEGVGLAYVQALVRKLGGDISVSSALGCGSTFSVVLPIDLEQHSGWRQSHEQAS
jgi:signal transduction histidine kinase